MLILLGLGLLWAVVLVPPMVRGRTAGSGLTGPSFSERENTGQLDIYHTRSAVQVTSSPPRTVLAARRRRRDILLVVAGAAVFTFLGGVAVGGFVLWTLHFMADLVFVGYAALVLQRQQPSSEDSAVVVTMRSTMDHPGLTGTDG